MHPDEGCRLRSKLRLSSRLTRGTVSHSIPTTGPTVSRRRKKSKEHEMAHYDSRNPRTEQPAAASRRVWWRKRRPGRLQGSMVAVSAAAIRSVYAVGYVESGHGDTGALAASPDSASASHTTADPTRPPGSATTRSAGTSGRSTQAAPAKTPTPSAQSAVYADGTYVGAGSSRHGSIQATVVVQGGKIVSADITGCGTRYLLADWATPRACRRAVGEVNHVSAQPIGSRACMERCPRRCRRRASS
jgi:uncharacterized protein with FMN-binding domain